MRRLPDLGVALLVVLALITSVSALRHVRASTTPAPAGAGGAPVPGPTTVPPRASRPSVTPSAPTPRPTPTPTTARATTPKPARTTRPPAPTRSTSPRPSRTPGVPKPAAAVVLLVGDSGPTNTWAGDASATGWPALVAARGHWTIVRIATLGYTTVAAPARKGARPAPGPVLPAGLNPAAVVVLASPRDERAGGAALARDAAALWRRLHAAYPRARIIALGPVPGPTRFSDAAARAAAARALDTAAVAERVNYANAAQLARAGLTSPRVAGLVLTVLPHHAARAG